MPPLFVILILFVVSCGGLGFLAGFISKRRGWSEVTSAIISLVIVGIWPALLMAAGAYVFATNERVDPGVSEDAAASLLVGGILLGIKMFVPSGFVTLAGARLGGRKASPGQTMRQSAMALAGKGRER